MSRGAVVALALAWGVVIVYGQVVRFDFVSYDDPLHVTETPAVRAGLTTDGVRWAFTTDRTSNWHPVSWLSHMLVVEAFGLRAGAHHAVNALLHLLNSLLLFAVLRAATRDETPSAIVAALFALHPLQVESVVWVTERRGLLATGFGLLALGAWIGWTRRGGAGRYAAALGLMAAGLMTKPTLVTLPFAMLLLDEWPLRRLGDPVRRVVEKLPFFALAAASSALTYGVQRRTGAMASGEALTAAQSVANAIVSYAWYVAKAVLPAGLAVHYPHPWLPAAGGAPPAAWHVAGAALLLVALTAAALRGARRGYPLVGWLWFLGTLVPVIGLVQVGNQAHADRYAYVPLVGLFVVVAWGGRDVVEELRARRPGIASAAPAVVGAALVALAATSFAQARHWRDSRALYERAVAVSPTDTTVLYNFGNHLLARGEPEAAIERFRRALEVYDANPLVHVNLGVALLETGAHEAAGGHFERAVELDPEDANAHYNLGNALLVGRDFERAVAGYESALRIEPDFPEAHYALGNALFELGRTDAAIRSYERALALRPDFPEARRNLAVARDVGRRGFLAPRRGAL